MRFAFILLSIFTVELTSCGKDKASLHTQVSGTVLEFGSNQLLGGVLVILSSKDKNNLTNLGTQTVQYLTTGSSGNFSFDFVADENRIYFVSASKFNYWDAQPYYPVTGKNNVAGFYLYPAAYLRFHLKNIHQTGKIVLGTPCEIGCEFLGQQIDTLTSFYKVKANSSQPIKWFTYQIDTITGSYLPPQSHDSIVYLSPFDSVTASINY